MQLNLFFYALSLLCSLASVAFGTLDARLRANVAVALAFALASIGVRPNGLPDPVWVGGIVAALGIVALVRPSSWTVVAACGGALAGIWVSMLEVIGLPLPAAVTVAAVPVVVAAYLTRTKPDFAPVALREEALLVVLVLGIVVAIAPGIVAGWQSAAILNLQQQEVASQAVPAWTLLLTLGAAATGGLYTVWMRR